MTFGTVHKLPSGRYRALYYGPDGKRRSGPATFRTKTEARKFLATVEADIVRGMWLAPAAPAEIVAAPLTLADYAQTWLSQRDLKPRTAEHYRALLDGLILPTSLAKMELGAITADDVRAWYAKLDRTKPTLRAHVYSLLRTILNTAVTDGKLSANPCVIRGAGTAKRAIQIRPATLDELTKLVNAMPDHYKAMVLLGAWCALRFGELTELRRKDIDVEGGVIRIRRGVVHVKTDGFIVDTPKSIAGVRDVAIPPHLLPALRDHLVNHVQLRQDSLLFPAHGGGHLPKSRFHHYFTKAREAADRPDLRFHDLRHTGAVLAASTGATLSELMTRLGHSSPAAALRYQHTAAGRDREIAVLLSKLATTK